LCLFIFAPLPFNHHLAKLLWVKPQGLHPQNFFTIFLLPVDPPFEFIWHFVHIPRITLITVCYISLTLQVFHGWQFGIHIHVYINVSVGCLVCCRMFLAASLFSHQWINIATPLWLWSKYFSTHCVLRQSQSCTQLRTTA
jgi:hypothetical protein